MESVVFVVIVVLVVVAVIAGAAAHQARHQRSAEFQQFAAGQGWQYVEQDDTYAKRWGGAPFNGGGTATDIVTGRHRERDFCAFTFSYTTSSYNGRTLSTQTHSFGITTITLPAPAPDFSVGEEEGMFGGKVAEAFGYARVDIADEDFNRTFKVKCDDQQFAIAVLQPPLVEMLKAAGPWEWRFTGRTMIAHDTGVLEPTTVPGRLDRMCEVLDHIPAAIWEGHPLPGTDLR